MAPFERAMVVSYRLSIDDHCNRCTICNHSAAICDRMSPTLKSTGGGSLWTQISRSSPWSRSMMFGSTESERPTLTNREIIFEEFQPVWSQSTNVTDRRTDEQTDDMWSQDRALHCSVSRGKNCSTLTLWQSALSNITFIIFAVFDLCNNNL